MAQTEQQSPPRTIAVPGDGTNSLSYTFPDAVALDLQSVFAAIDAGGAGDTIATVTIEDQSGVVIASKAQTEPIPTGDTGSATWALRLADEGGGAASRTFVGAEMQRDAGGVAQNIANDALLGNAPTALRHNRSDWSHGVTVDLVSNPSKFVIVTAGVYLIQTDFVWLPGNFPNAGLYTDALCSTPVVTTGSATGRIIANQPNRLVSVGIAPLNAGDTLKQRVGQNTGGPLAAPQGTIECVRLGPLP